MKIEKCFEHEGCHIYDGDHVRDDVVDKGQFPDWPPTKGEAERGVSDSVLMEALSSALDNFNKLDTDLENVSIAVSMLQNQVGGLDENRKGEETRLKDRMSKVEREVRSCYVKIDNLRNEVKSLDTLVKGAVVEATQKLEAMETRSRWVDQHEDLRAAVKRIEARLKHESEERLENTRKLMRSLQNVRQR